MISVDVSDKIVRERVKRNFVPTYYSKYSETTLKIL